MTKQRATQETTQASARPGALRDYPIVPVPFTDVQLNDHFWAPRIETNRTATIPFAFDKCEVSGRVDLFRRAARALQGDATVDRTPSEYVFDETDVYKVIEGAAYSLRIHSDPELEGYIDGLIQVIARAQEADGYLYPARTIDPAHPHPNAGATRWSLERAHSHELYNLGHLYEAALAYANATGKRDLLEIALRSAHMLVETFGEGKQTIWPGHQITELALVRLYRETGEEEYLDLARAMLEARGPDGSPGAGLEYNQSHLPILEQGEAVGHAVRATYMYAGIADVAAILARYDYIAALERIWQDVVGCKMYVTGGLGALHYHESFGRPYELPNATAYAETCAAIGSVFWNHRMFLLSGEGKYMDELERALYNGMLVGISLDGMAFFYDNPLESDGWHERKPWFGCACCPGNLARVLPSIPGYQYAVGNRTIYVNLFAASTATIQLSADQVVGIRQEGNYPWHGSMRLIVEETPHAEWQLKIRIPGWARGEAVAGDLYHFADVAFEPFALHLNGEAVVLTPELGYVTITRSWRAGDVVELRLPMPVRRVVAHARVESARGRVALQRGPLIYCLESVDNPAVSVGAALLDDDDAISTGAPLQELLGAVPLRFRASVPAKSGSDAVQANQAQAHQVSAVAIPYFAWANRGRAEMIVWLRREEGSRH